MSRLDDLIDLIQTTNEVYFITAPGRVRTAYILVDDIVELSLKTYLQEKTLERQAACISKLESVGVIQNDRQRKQLKFYFDEDIDFNQLCSGLGLNGQSAQDNLQNLLVPYQPLQHWSVNNPEERVEFDKAVTEAKDLYGPNPTLGNLLDEMARRHKNRNKFYHDHHQSGLTIDDDKCLRALCDLFSLMELLFPDFLDAVRLNKVIRCQIGVLRLKLAAHGDNEIKRPYLQALKQLGKRHIVDEDSENFEHTIVHTVTENFFIALKEQLRNSIGLLELRLDKIDRMAHPTLTQLTERSINQRMIAILTRQFDEINNLVGTP